MSRHTEPCCALWQPHVRHDHEYGCPSQRSPFTMRQLADAIESGALMAGLEVDQPVPYVLSHPAVGALEELLAALDVPGKPDTTEDQLFRILRAVDHARDVVSEARLAE